MEDIEKKRNIVQQFIEYSNDHNDDLYGHCNDVSNEKQLALCSEKTCCKIILRSETRIKGNGKVDTQFYQRCCECGNIYCEDHSGIVETCGLCYDSFCQMHLVHKCL